MHSGIDIDCIGAICLVARTWFFPFGARSFSCMAASGIGTVDIAP
jgi:hypothetical protein